MSFFGLQMDCLIFLLSLKCLSHFKGLPNINVIHKAHFSKSFTLICWGLNVHWKFFCVLKEFKLLWFENTPRPRLSFLKWTQFYVFVLVHKESNLAHHLLSSFNTSQFIKSELVCRDLWNITKIFMQKKWK